MRLPNFWHGPHKSANATLQPKRVPHINKTENLTVNKDLTYGLYHNQYAGTKLAGALAFNPIAVPVAFMGVPSVMSEDKLTQKRIDKLIKDFFVEMTQIHTECHRDGTVWVFPFYSATDKKLHWEYIPDETITIIKDIDTNNIISIRSEETVTVNISGTEELSTTRVRTFTKAKIEEVYLGAALPSFLHNRTKVNVAGILPIPFSNNPDLNEVRGHSDYERIVPDLKDYHDIDFARSTILSKFKGKMVINLPDGNATTFLNNNGFRDISEVDIADMDLILLTGTNDSATFVFPGLEASSGYTEALDTKFKKIVEASGVPEIAWGLKTTGNSNSSEDSMSTLLNFVKSKQDQKTVQYHELFKASLRILSVAEMNLYKYDDISVEWGKLDGISMINKAAIFANFMQGISTITDKACGTKQQVYKMWKQFYPEETEDTFDEFIKGLSGMAQYSALVKASFEDLKDLANPIDTDTTGVDMSKMPEPEPDGEEEK
jgi:hypothetical protein